MPRDIENKILKEIKKRGMKPKPRWYFVLRNFSFWFLSFLFILIGGVSFASLLYKISNTYEVLQFVFDNNLLIFKSVLLFIPYIWLLLLIIFLFLAIYNFKKTEFAYRYNLTLIVSLFFLASVIFGVLIFYFGLSAKTEQIYKNYIPFYERYSMIMNLRKKLFIEKMIGLGITSEILNKNLDLKKQVEKKFDLNVLGKNYIYTKPEGCEKTKFTCQKDEIFFEDKKGCGCRKTYVNLK